MSARAAEAHDGMARLDRGCSASARSGHWLAVAVTGMIAEQSGGSPDSGSPDHFAP
jgi:hypothetical protein